MGSVKRQGLKMELELNQEFRLETGTAGCSYTHKKVWVCLMLIVYSAELTEAKTFLPSPYLIKYRATSSSREDHLHIRPTWFPSEYEVQRTSNQVKREDNNKRGQGTNVTQEQQMCNPRVQATWAGNQNFRSGWSWDNYAVAVSQNLSCFSEFILHFILYRNNRLTWNTADGEQYFVSDANTLSLHLLTIIYVGTSDYKF